MGKPAFIFGSYDEDASVTADTTATNFDAEDVLNEEEGSRWKPNGTLTTEKLIIDRNESTAFDTCVFLGNTDLDGVKVGLVSSTDNFSSDASNVLPELSEDSNFAFGVTESNSVWEIDSTSQWEFPSSGGAYIDGTQTVEDYLTQVNGVESGKYYVFTVKLSGVASGSGDLYVEAGSNRSAGMSADGVYSFGLLSNGTSVHLVADAASAGDFEGTVDFIIWSEMKTLSVPINAAKFSFDGCSDRYISVVLANYPSTVEVAHIGLRTQVYVPQFAMSDWHNAEVDGVVNISKNGYYQGSQVHSVLRKYRLMWKPMPESSDDFTNILSWKVACLEGLLPFFLVPDTEDESVVYFCWTEGSPRFSAPKENKDMDNVRVGSVTVVTRGL